MTRLLSLLPILACATVALAAGDSGSKPGGETVFHEPFTLRLYVDEDHVYEEKFGRIPFVHEGDVYLFKGDEFGLDLDIQGNSIRTVRYQPISGKADVTLKFTQNVQPDGAALMMLTIHNNTKHVLYTDALMTVPGRKGIGKTSILPVQPGLSGFESWPHPIVQLVLRNLRVAK